jgi:hypothetical protein
MGACSSVDVVNPHFVDLSHFELMKVVGKGGFGKVRTHMHHWNTHCAVPDAAVAVDSLSSVELVTLKFRSLLYLLCLFQRLRIVVQVNAVSKKDTGELMALKRMEKFAVLQSAAHLKSVVTHTLRAFRSQPATRSWHVRSWACAPSTTIRVHSFLFLRLLLLLDSPCGTEMLQRCLLPSLMLSVMYLVACCSVLVVACFSLRAAWYGWSVVS